MVDAGSRRIALALTLVVLAALALRAGAAVWPGQVISRDGVRYAKIARRFAEGDLAGALANDYAPGLPAAAALAGRISGAADDRGFGRAAVAVSIVAGALSALAAFALARRAPCPRAGLFAALAVALHPHHVAISADALTEPLAGLFALGALAAGVEAAESSRDGAGARRSTVAAAISGALGGLGFLARPDAFLAGLAPLALPGARARRGLAFAAALAVVGAPYVARASLDIGRFRISKKQDAARLLEAASADPTAVLRNAARNLGRAAESGQVISALALAGLAIGLARGGARRRLAAACGLAALATLATCSLVRHDPRFGLEVSLLLAPLAGLALEEAATRLEIRPPRAAALVAVALAAAALPGVVHVAAPDRPHLLACAAALERAAADDGIAAPIVLARDPRIAYYAGADGSNDDHAVPRPTAEADFIVLEDGEALPRAVRARRLARFEPPPGSHARALEAFRVER